LRQKGLGSGRRSASGWCRSTDNWMSSFRASCTSQLKRVVFVAEGRKNDLLPYEVKVYRRSQQVLWKQSLKDPCSVPCFFSWQSLVPPSDLPLKRTTNIREPSFDETGAQNAIFRSGFLCIANRPIYFAPQRASSGPRHPTTPIARVVFWATVSSGAPRHRHVQLEGQFRSLVHTLCV
jgi:hypothetical protein